MPFQTVKGLRIYYEIHGEEGGTGTILLLHHGFGCTKIWKDVYPGLADAGYRVVMYDRRGYGQSEMGDAFFEFYTSDRYRPESVDELAAITRALNIDSFHIVGQCEGGVVGVDYAVRYPEQVRTLSISSTQCYSNSAIREKNRHDFPKPFRELEPELKAKMREWHGDNAEPFYDQFRQYGGAYGSNVFDLRNILPSVRCPTLVLYPDRSSIFPVEQGVAFYRNLPGGQLAVLPACGHNTYQYRPRAYVREVLDFIDRSNSDAETSQRDTHIGMSCLAVKK